MQVNVNVPGLGKFAMVCLYCVGLYHIGRIPDGGLLAAIMFCVFSCTYSFGWKEFSFLPESIQIILGLSITVYGGYCLFV